MPLCCPKCNNVMKKRLDKPNYRIHKMCFDCVIDFEGKLQNKGLKEQYLKELELKNNLTIIDQTEAQLLDIINTSNSGYVSEDGVIEKWVGGINKQKWTKDITKYAAQVREKFEKELNDQERIKRTN